MNLADTVGMMNSPDYQERFKAEYAQLVIRMKGLKVMLMQYAEGTLSFSPKCSYDELEAQFFAMDSYAHQLEKRAKIEGIDLDINSILGGK